MPSPITKYIDSIYYNIGKLEIKIPIANLSVSTKKYLIIIRSNMVI